MIYYVIVEVEWRIFMKHSISVLVENNAGVLSRICGLFSRRGFNIDSLAVGTTDDPEISRITIVADGNEYTVEQIEKQLNKLVEVIKGTYDCKNFGYRRKTHSGAYNR